MNGLRAALRSSPGKKYVMAVTGLLLCLFLVAHLAGNILLYVGPKAYNDYAHALHKNEWLVKTAEAGLIVLFGAHLYLAVSSTRENRSARGPVGYTQKQTKIDRRDSTVKPDTWMFISGGIVLAFLILHLVDFTFLLRPDVPYEELEGKEFTKAVMILQTPLTFVVYVTGCAILGFHLGHGVASAFQSLGINHPRYNTLIHWLGVIFAAAMAVGFGSFPVWALFVGGR